MIGALQLVEKGKPTTVWLFDSPTLDLNQQGLRLRLRERGKHTELTLKVAGQNCATVDAALLKPDGKCEADLHGDSFDDVVSLSREIDKRSRAALLAADTGRGAPLVDALSGDAGRPSAHDCSPSSAVSRAAPRCCRRTSSGWARRPCRPTAAQSQPYVVEVWTLPGGQQFVELSQKVGAMRHWRGVPNCRSK